MSTFHSLQAEQAVLGSMLIDASTYARVAPMLAVTDFHRADHRFIYGAITAVARGGAAPDVLLVHEELKRQGHEDASGGLAYLSQLARETASAANAVDYASVVRDRAVGREGLEAAEQFTAALQKGQGAKEALGALE